MNPVLAARLRVAAVLVGGIVVQTTFGADLRVDGVAPDLMLLLAVAGGLVGGADTGAIIGFFAGLLADLSLTTTPLGLTALAWCLTGYAVGRIRSTYLPDDRLLQPVIGLVASAAGILLFLIIGDLAGQRMLIVPGRAYLVKVVVIEAVWNAVLIVPVAALLGRAARGTQGADRLRRSDARVP